MKLFTNLGRVVDNGLTLTGKGLCATGRSIESGLCRMHARSNSWLMEHPGVCQTISFESKAHNIAWLQTKAQIEGYLAERGIVLSPDSVEP